MARCVFDNLTPEQAKELAEWYEGPGEQDAADWFDFEGVNPVWTDITREGGCKTVLENGDVIVHCRDTP